MDSLSTEAQKDLKDLGYKVETIPGTRQIRITAPTKDARGALQALIADADAEHGNTLSERVRVWFRVHTRPGRAVFAIAWVGFATWFLVHILN
ncbi:hypothetical protein GCM10009601_41570 [Streptomyces thermospinosisporus]|uniref:Uncharacterized protein n=1 Tax=Streptomyces thermospinosisporus TaxID=161482 RepID=A0ABP4JTN5_9ACTN